jgi:hypothetical protein
MYFSWGLFGGALGGLSVPIARSAASSIPVLFLIFLPLAVAVHVMESGWHEWNIRVILGIFALSLLMGLIWGPLTWKQLHKREEHES